MQQIPREEISRESSRLQNVIQEMHRVVVGLDDLIVRLFVALLADGHVLIEGVPGLAKTLAVRTLAGVIGVPFQRIQFTPDLLPADLIGTQIYNPQTTNFEARPGPIFSNIVLADEINRAPAKVQSALLEAMEERQVTLGNQTIPLANPFMVLATQNPIEQEGTYPLPEAQLDRFTFKLLVSYPSREEEKEIVRRMALSSELPTIRTMMQSNDILYARRLIKGIPVKDPVVEYVLSIVSATRGGDPDFKQIAPYIKLGASPRATLSIINGAKALAFLRAHSENRVAVIPDDIRAVVFDCLRHRIMLSFEADADGITADDIIQMILQKVRAP